MSPLLADLSGPTEGSGVEVGKDSEGNFVGKNREGVNPNDVGELVGEERQLRETAHGQQTLEDQGTPGMGRSGEICPDGVYSLSLLQRESI